MRYNGINVVIPPLYNIKKKKKILILLITYLSISIHIDFLGSEKPSWYYFQTNSQSRVQTSNIEEQNTLQLRLQYQLRPRFKSNLSIHGKRQII